MTQWPVDVGQAQELWTESLGLRKIARSDAIRRGLAFPGAWTR